RAGSVHCNTSWTSGIVARAPGHAPLVVQILLSSCCAGSNNINAGTRRVLRVVSLRLAAGGSDGRGWWLGNRDRCNCQGLRDVGVGVAVGVAVADVVRRVVAVRQRLRSGRRGWRHEVEVAAEPD